MRGQVVATLGLRILGRTAAEDVLHPETGEVLIDKGTTFDERDVDIVENAEVKNVLIRSALTCETQNGICAKCYGRDLARGTPVNMGDGGWRDCCSINW